MLLHPPRSAGPELSVSLSRSAGAAPWTADRLSVRQWPRPLRDCLAALLAATLCQRRQHVLEHHAELIEDSKMEVSVVAGEIVDLASVTEEPMRVDDA